MAVKTISELYVTELKDLYSAERQLVVGLPRVAKAATSPQLVAAFEAHLEQTKRQVVRLEKIFEMLGEEPTGHMCKAMEGLMEEAADVVEDVEKGPLRDCALVVGAQKVEHYEISGYGSASALAKLLGEDQHVKLLQETLNEESDADYSLTALAESEINPAALAQHA